MEKKYEWSVSVSAPKEYPVVIQKGFVGKSFFGPSSISSSWGIGLEVAKKQAFVVPDDFEITWLSLVERKFYKGKWILPKNKIEQYLEKGVNYHNKRIKYNKIQIGLAPKGMVIVWLLGDQGMQIEIGRYQATQTILDSKDVYDSSKFMFEKNFIDNKLNDPKFVAPEIKKNIEEYGYPAPTIYDFYREKYIWEPKIIMPEECKISRIEIKMCNGENVIATDVSDLETDKKTIPYLFKINWKDKKGQEFISRIVLVNNNEYWQKYLTHGKEELPLNFDKNSIISLFKVNKNLPTVIVIKINNESISDFYLEQIDKRYLITEFSQNTEKVLKNTPCICK